MKKLLLVWLLALPICYGQKNLDQVSLKDLDGKIVTTKKVTDNDVVVFSLWSLLNVLPAKES